MNAETLKRIEALYDKWCNECPTQPEFIDVARDVMDLMPDLIQAVKERVNRKDVEPLVEALRFIKLCLESFPNVASLDATRERARNALAQWEKEGS